MKLTIEKLKTGYMITEDNGEQHAVWYPEQLIKKMKELFGIEKRYADVRKAAIVDTAQEQPSTPLQKIKELAQVKDAHGLLIPKFEYDESQKKDIEGYTNLSVVEMPDGRAVLMYGEAHYYTTKEKILTIPHPVPFGYFKGKGVSSVAVTCLRAYRSYLANPAPQPTAYVSKSTQDRIKEASERKPVPPLMTAEDVLELEMQREVERKKGDARPQKLDIKEKKEMVIKMGVQ